MKTCCHLRDKEKEKVAEKVSEKEEKGSEREGREEEGDPVVLCDQLMCWQSHHSFVLNGNFSSSVSSLQSKFVSAQPKISNSHLESPILMFSHLQYS